MKPVTPNTNFPELERQILNSWKTNNIISTIDEATKNAPEFAFYDGPPFANGTPHYGHLLASTIKDSVLRYWNMRGFKIRRRFGWDCHGFPVEYEVEKKFNLKGRTDILAMGIDTFNEECRKIVNNTGDQWKTVIERIGRWVNWDDMYRTMDPKFMESVWWVFAELYSKGLVYRDYKIVAYSPRLSAVLSNFEANQNYKDVQDPALTIRFKVENENAYFLAWTTTPWTLISNLGLAANPKAIYAKVNNKTTGEHYYLAKNLIAKVFAKELDNYEIISECMGHELFGKKYEPLFPYFASNKNAFKVVTGDFVTTDDGTGLVHIAPAYGEDDFNIGKLHNLGLEDPLDAEGRFTPQIAEYAGMSFKDADKEIIKALKAQHSVVYHDTIVHSYPFCDRTDTPLMYRTIPAWYVAVEKIKTKVIEHNKTINWVPQHLQAGRMGRWLEGARDWAISRNRFWGTPIPIWVCNNNPNHVHVISSISELEQKTNAKLSDIHKHYIDNLQFSCPHCAGSMQRIPEVFDCWFESGSMPYAQDHFPFDNKEKFHGTFPADFIAEGLDQTRGWFYTLSILAAALFYKPAFKNVIVNGIVLDAKGQKMSKRFKNYTPPEELLEQAGADAVRLYLLSSPAIRADDICFSDKGVKETVRSVLLPLWNAYSFLSTYANADNWQPNETNLQNHKAPSSTSDLDLWIVSRFHTLLSNVNIQMEKYQLHAVVPLVLSFIEDLTNWYIRLSRRRFWGTDDNVDTSEQSARICDSSQANEAYETLFYILHGFVSVFAPFAPFLSEHIYLSLTEGLQNLPKSVHATKMPQARPELINAPLEKRMDFTRRVVNLGRTLRAKHKIKTRQVLQSMLIITPNAADAELVEQGKELILQELNLKNIEFSTDEVKYVNLLLKPNWGVLGPKLGEKVKDLRANLTNLNTNVVLLSQAINTLSTTGELELGGIKLTQSDLLADRMPKGDRVIATDNDIIVLLDTTLTPELINEGLAREVVNRIQKIRRDLNLNVSSRIEVTIQIDKKLQLAIESNLSYICAETLAKDIIFSDAALENAVELVVGEYNGRVMCKVTS